MEVPRRFINVGDEILESLHKGDPIEFVDEDAMSGCAELVNLRRIAILTSLQGCLHSRQR